MSDQVQTNTRENEADEPQATEAQATDAQAANATEPEATQVTEATEAAPEAETAAAEPATAEAPATETPATETPAPAVSLRERSDDDSDDDGDEDYDEYDDEDVEDDDSHYVEGPAEYVQREKGGRARRIGSDIRVNDIDYKNIPMLSRFLDRRGRILSRRKTKVNAKVQRSIVKAIKRARHLALLPYTGDHTRVVQKRGR